MADKYEAQRRYAERNGLISKSYKIDKSLAEDFRNACESQGVSQAGKIQELMQEWLKTK